MSTIHDDDRKQLAVPPIVETAKLCGFCRRPIPPGKRADAKYCCELCRKGRWREDQKLTAQIDFLMGQLDRLQKQSPERFQAILQRYTAHPVLPATTDATVSAATKTHNRLGAGSDD